MGQAEVRAAYSQAPEWRAAQKKGTNEKKDKRRRTYKQRRMAVVQIPGPGSRKGGGIGRGEEEHGQTWERGGDSGLLQQGKALVTAGLDSNRTRDLLDPSPGERHSRLCSGRSRCCYMGSRPGWGPRARSGWSWPLQGTVVLCLYMYRGLGAETSQTLYRTLYMYSLVRCLQGGVEAWHWLCMTADPLRPGRAWIVLYRLTVEQHGRWDGEKGSTNRVEKGRAGEPLSPFFIYFY